MNLFQIEEEIMKCVDMETGEIIDSEKLDKLQMDREQKIENIALWIKNLVSDAEALKAEKQIFADRQRAAENKAASLKKYLSDYLAGEKYKSAKVSISFRKSEAVNILDISQIPEQYLKVAEPTVDKTGIKNALKAGEFITGAELIENQNIQIR